MSTPELALADLATEARYLHGYSRAEQARLVAQARVLEAGVFEDVDFSASRRILEVGCGVGAQTEILLERFPGLRVDGVDMARTQIERARSYFSDHAASARARFLLADARALPGESGTYDGAFFCWVLEHASDPVALLQEVRRVLVPGGVVHLNEVFNQLLYVRPNSDAIERYWHEYNRLQSELGGDPWVGGKLGHYLSQAGFSQIEPHVEHWDSRSPGRRTAMVLYWTELMLTAAPKLLELGRVDARLVEKMKSEMMASAAESAGVLFFGWMKARARA